MVNQMRMFKAKVLHFFDGFFLLSPYACCIHADGQGIQGVVVSMGAFHSVESLNPKV